MIPSELIEKHIPLVYSIGRHLHERLTFTDYDDLIGFGMQGLMEAAHKYDPIHGTVFSTFAYYRIRGAMLDGLRLMGWISKGHVGRWHFEDRTNRYLQDAGEETKMGMDAEDGMGEISASLYGLATIFIVSTVTPPQGDGPIYSTPPPQEKIEQTELYDKVKLLLPHMPTKEKQLLELYYFGDKTIEQVGDLLGLSKSWSSRLHARAVLLLRKALLKDKTISPDEILSDEH